MKISCDPFLQGDGIKISFFHYLWMKNRGHNKEYEKGCREEAPPRKNSNCTPQLRLPDTVIFRLGRPWQWYFTSERGGHPSILRKRKQNLNVEKVQEIFLRKGRAANKGWLDSHNDVIAYFISSSKENAALLQPQKNSIEGSKIGINTISLSSSSSVVKNDENSKRSQVQEKEEDCCCNIEYFNEEALSK
jgi:hypothetical protein